MITQDTSNMRTINIIAGLLILSITGTAQMKKANQSFDHHHYKEAIELYNVVIRKDLDNDVAITNLAVSYWKTEQYSLAEYWFTRAALMNDDPRIKLWYGQLLISNEKYVVASEWINKYADAETDPVESRKARKIADYCLALSRGEKLGFDCDVYPVELNTKSLDFAPLLWNDKLIFTSNRDGVTMRDNEKDPWTSSGFTDIFSAKRLDANTFSDAVNFDPVLNTPYHEGPLWISEDGNELFMTQSDVTHNKRKFDSSRNTRLTLRQYLKDKDGIWQQQADLPFVSSEFSTVHPVLFHGGKTLVFASDRPEGFGGMDLYLVERTDEGWGEPRNLGQQINTQGNEVFPSCDAGGNLFFASDLHIGFGGLDIYKSEATMTEWGAPQNLGIPINSPRDDFSICWDKGGESGFISSNRNISGKDDLLYFELSKSVHVEGQIFDCETREPIAHVTVELEGEDFHTDMAFSDELGKFSFSVPQGMVVKISALKQGYKVSTACAAQESFSTEEMEVGDRIMIQLALLPNSKTIIASSYICGKVVNSKYGNPLSGVVLQLVDRCTGETIEAITDATGSFHLRVEEGCEYEVSATKGKFIEFRSVFTSKNDGKNCQVLEMSLTFIEAEIPPLLAEDVVIRKGMILELFHIYFNRDEYVIEENAIPDLQTLYKILIDHPDIKGEIMAHTDSRATIGYNMELSANRAEATLDWLVGKGISRDRLTAKGYGESMLKNRCSDGIECSEDEHQRNRRVEFRVTDVGEHIDQMCQEKPN
jgi:outer membrane protein OmpA-like peptidoglycan-associated protein